jgi:membrane protease YdiL (CAAX protease family)
MSASASLSAGQAARLLVGLRLRRLLNQLTVSIQLMRRQKVTGEKRAATAGKAKLGWLLASLVGASMLFGVANLSTQAVSNIQTTLGFVQRAAPNVPSGKQAKAPANAALPAEAGSTLSKPVLQALALLTAILIITVLMFALGTGELAKADWDMEWLATLPVSLPTLLAVRIAERTFISGGLVLLWPFLSVVAVEAGYAWSALPLALLAAVPLLAIVATVRTIVDTGLRLSLSPATLRNLQAVLGVAGLVLMYLAMSAGMTTSSYVLTWAPFWPEWGAWLPPGLATRVVSGTGWGSIGPALAVLIVETLAILAAGLMLLHQQLRMGVVGAGARESGRRPAAAVGAPAGGAVAAPRGRRLLTPIQARELTLLMRDRTFLVQSLVLPVMIILTQVWFNTGGDLMTGAWTTPRGLAAVAFSIAAYALMFSAFQTLNTEGNALWILYSVPHSLESILRQKAVLWAGVCMAYPVVALAVAPPLTGVPLGDLAGPVLIAALGVPIFAVIATALGVFASDPLAQVVQRRLRPSYMYLYVLLAGLYVYAIFASTMWERLGQMVLTALLALALWQKARDHLPYLLDPTESPPSRVSLSDGLVAAMMFFVLQGLVAAIYMFNDVKPTVSTVLVGFSIAGAVTVGLMRFVYWRIKSAGVPRTLGAGGLQAAGWGAAAGVGAGLAGLAYVLVARRTGLFEGAQQAMLLGTGDRGWLILLTVAAAPVFEEFIFRGLIFGGLRRTLGLGVSVIASAAIFAIVHPPFAVLPVFVLGLAAALIYDRTRLLIAPIAAHAVYNAIVVGHQLIP